jgi:hypothetical protein
MKKTTLNLSFTAAPPFDVQGIGSMRKDKNF